MQAKSLRYRCCKLEFQCERVRSDEIAGCGKYVMTDAKHILVHVKHLHCYRFSISINKSLPLPPFRVRGEYNARICSGALPNYIWSSAQAYFAVCDFDEPPQWIAVVIFH